MMRKLGMKRSFHCVDLPSIASFEQYGGGEESSMPNCSYLPLTLKRRRAVSADSSSGCWCIDDDKDNDGEVILPTTIKILPVDDDTVSSNVRLVSPTTSSHSAVVTPTMLSTPNLPIDDVHGSPRLPSLSSTRPHRDTSDAFPATAALERFMHQRRGINLSVLVDYPLAFKRGSDGGDSWQSSNSTCQNFDREHELSSPRQVHDFPSETEENETYASRESSCASFACSPSDRDHHHLPLGPPPKLSLTKEVCTDTDVVSACTPAPSLELHHHPTKSFSLQPRMDVNQLSEALSRL